jgi:hypothetical protein
MIGAAQAQSNAEKAARLPAIKAGTRPERCKAMVSVSGYLIGNQEAGKVPLPPKAELQWWYQFYFATERGRQGYDKHPRDFSSSSGRSHRRSGFSTMLRCTRRHSSSTMTKANRQA